ncbi:MAG: hypothetical protein H7A35_08000 [Planctomycetales bacterium]|nr:hypothetical protein [bacterium]UNM09996.1 MAG: hypothetical protein H7A35_08000 [Planctomycetales bacterium]
MDSLQVTVYEGRIPAMILLAVYLAAVVVLFPREMKFLREVQNATTRRIFIVQDIFIQVCILGVLVPAILMKGVNEQNDKLLGLLLILSMTGLWLCVIWAGWSRYIYTCRILSEGSKRSAEELRRIQELLRQKGIDTDEIKDVDA